jgi:serine phosphatase RsbU (regulator of sigma subunit)
MCQVCKDPVELYRLEVQPVTEVCLGCITTEERNRLEEELYLASRIHRALLPQHVARIDGFDIAVKSLAARVVGGDYYDFLPSRDGRIVRVMIADTMGKGLPAGLVMSNLQGALRVLADEIDSPALLLHRVNQWLCRNIPITKFVSVACIGIRTTNGGTARISHANAGHCPAILIRKDGSNESLNATGTLIGVHEDFTYTEESFEMSAGDMLLLYTDGVTEAENSAGEMYEEDRLIQFARDHHVLPADRFAEELMADVARFSGRSELSDDLTLIALRKE